MKKIKILFYEPSSGFGGSPRSLRDILLKLDKERFQPIIAVLDDGPAIKELMSLGFDVRPMIDKKGMQGPVFKPEIIKGYWDQLKYMGRMVLPLSYKLARLIRKEQVDIVHVNTLIRTGLEAIFAARLTNTPSICHLRSTCEWSRLERKVAFMVSKFICLTNDAMKIYAKYTDKDKLVMVYNGIDLKKNSPGHDLKDVKVELGISPGSKVVGLVGRIADGKGQDIFLKAAKLVVSKCPETKFLIVGDVLTEDQKKFKNGLFALSDELGIAGNVIFTGWRQDALDVIANMDILVQASTWFPEGFGRTCVEAMALEVPLVVTNIPGPSEIVVNDETGFVVPPGDVEGMADAILTLLTNKPLSDKFAKNGRKRAEELFDLNKTVKQIENVYLELVSPS